MLPSLGGSAASLSKDELRYSFNKDKHFFKELFEQADIDGSGYLDKREMAIFFKKIGKQNGDLRKMYREIDKVCCKIGSVLVLL